MKAQDFFLLRKKQIIDLHLQKDISQINFTGLDRSLTGTGLSIVRNGRCVLQKEIGSKYYGPQRLLDISKQIFSSLLSNTLIITEGYAFSAHSRSVTGLAELWGTLATFFYMKKIPYLEAAPTTLKKFVAKSGHARKENMMLHVYKKFGIEPETNNIADAIGLAFLGHDALNYANGSGEHTKVEIECFNTLLSLTPKKKKKNTNKQLALEINDE